METRFQHILLNNGLMATILVVALSFTDVYAADKADSKLRINSELFDFGVVTGILNIEDFPAEFVVGASVTFKASEDFFLQYNYVQAEVSESSFEKNPSFTVLDLGDDRSFKHYDLLVGYNIFQGEFFTSGDTTNLSSLYVVGGIGDTTFGGEENFTYTIGMGYQVEFYRRYLLRFDFRDYIYNTSLIVGGEEDTAHNSQISVGVGYLF